MPLFMYLQGIEAVLLLISFGADVNGITDERHDFRTVLHYGVLSGNHDIVTLLIKQGAKVVFSPDYRKPTPLDLAILKGDPELVRILVQSGTANMCQYHMIVKKKRSTLQFTLIYFLLLPLIKRK
jgi:ankyrin repeat protein